MHYGVPLLQGCQRARRVGRGLFSTAFGAATGFSVQSTGYKAHKSQVKLRLTKWGNQIAVPQSSSNTDNLIFLYLRQWKICSQWHLIAKGTPNVLIYTRIWYRNSIKAFFKRAWSLVHNYSIRHGGSGGGPVGHCPPTPQILADQKARRITTCPPRF